MTTLVATPNSEASPAPYVDLLVQSIDAGTATFTVWRTAEGRTFRVRGLVQIAASAGIGTIQDFEAPLNVVSEYRVEHYNSSGASIGYSAVTATTLEAPAGTAAYHAWFHNPFDPASTVRVELRGQGQRNLVRATDYEMFHVPGRSVGVAVFAGSRRGYEGLVLDCATMTRGDEIRFDALFGDYDDATIPVVCVRTLPATRLPATLFAVVGAPTKSFPDRVDLGDAMWWAISGDEVSPPPEAFVSTLLDYQDFTAFFSSYATFSAAYTDYTAATRDYTKAGIA